MGLLHRIVCAVSGGVDSAVSAYLLKKRGFEVIGVYMINWDNVEEGTSSCPRTKDESDAAELCRSLGIEFHTVNFVQEYWNQIFSYLLENYTRGRTIVPDILCNKVVKFELLHKFAFEKLHADAVATGHFVRTTYGAFLEKRHNTSTLKLLTGVDPLKDQSYFLCTLNKAQLSRSIFPVGSLLKTEVRSIAKAAGLNVAEKPESMGICFIGKRKNFSAFLDQYLEKREGPIRYIETGEELGKHNGIHHFNIGKRLKFDPKSRQCPFKYFVTSLDCETNTVWVCDGSTHPSLYATEFTIKEPQWIRASPLEKSNAALVEFRCQRTHPAFVCNISRIQEGILKVSPRNPVRAAAPGQVCVMYEGDECLGGGEILEVLHTLYC